MLKLQEEFCTEQYKVTLTFRGLCIMIYSYKKTNEMH